MSIDLDDIYDCDKCGCIFNKRIATISKVRRDWYGTDCKANCPVCGEIIEFNLGDGYYK